MARRKRKVDPVRSAAAKRGWKTRCERLYVPKFEATRKEAETAKRALEILAHSKFSGGALSHGGYDTTFQNRPAVRSERPAELFAANNLQKRKISSGLPSVNVDWLGAAGWVAALVATGVFLYTRFSEAKPPPLPKPSVPEPIARAPLTVEDEEIIKDSPVEPVEPSGSPAVELASNYRRLKSSEVTPALAAIAQESLKFPLGHIEFFTHDGQRYAASLEEHFHEPGGLQKPWGKHKGVSLYVHK